MKTTRFCVAAGMFLTVLAFSSGWGIGAVINFSTPVTMSGDTDVLNAGASVFAYDVTGNAETINGISFAGFGSGVTVSNLGGDYGGFLIGNGAPASNLSTAYQNVLTGGYYNNGGAATLTLNGLASGVQYAVQVGVDDSRGCCDTRTETVSSGGNTVTLAYNSIQASGGLGQYTIGTFTADTATQVITLTSNASTQLNGLQLQILPFTSSVGFWNGTNGSTWDTNTTANFSVNAANSPFATGTFSHATSAVQTAYFGDYYYDSNSSGGTVAVTQNNVTVAAGGVSTGIVYFQNSAVNYTLTSADSVGITGSTAVGLIGQGAVNFNGPNTYMGPTTISAGVLVLGNSAAVQNSTVSVNVTNGLQFAAGLGTASLGGLAGTANFVLSDQAGGPVAPVVGSNNANTTYNGALSGNGSLTMAGTGTLSLGGNLTYTGSTIINSGNININGAVINQPTVVNSGGTLTLNTGGPFNGVNSA